ncbi:MAG: heavy metal translocating P-type ATPase, partial [Caldilineaceae bacterium]
IITAPRVGISSTLIALVDKWRRTSFHFLPRRKTTSRRTPLIEQLTAEQTSLARTPAQPATTTLAEQESTIEALINHYLGITAFSLLIATAGALFLPPLQLLALPGLLYAAIPIWREAYNVLTKERRFRMVCVDAIGIPIALVLGYFAGAALLFTLHFGAKKLLLKTQDRSKKNLTNLIGEQPRSVWLLTNDGVEVEIPFEKLQVDDTIVMSAGEMIPIDGVIVKGHATIDERMLTGEAQPVEKSVGEEVFAATLILQGKIQIAVKTAGNETVAAQIGTILLRTADFKSSVQLRGEMLGDQAAFPLLLLSGLAFMTVGPVASLAVFNAPLVNTIRLASPLSVIGFLQQALYRGILVKDGRALELLSDVDTIVFDKTGTLTQEQPTVRAVHLCATFDENELLRLAAAAEQRQSHPVAKAILAAAQERRLALPAVEDITYEVGYGLAVHLPDYFVQLGSQQFMELAQITIPPEMSLIQQACHRNGDSLVYVAVNGKLAGGLELQPTVRPESATLVAELKKRGFETYIISGDRAEPTRKLAEQLQVDHYFAETLPEAKADLIEQLQRAGKKVCYVGDGINDSIALKKANVPVSLSGATSIATDTAQVVLLDGALTGLIPLLDIATALNRNMQRNVLISLVSSTVCIGGAFFFHLGLYSAIALCNLSLLAGVANAATAFRQTPTGDKPTIAVKSTIPAHGNAPSLN